MKKVFIAPLILLTFILLAMTHDKKRKIVFFGDSITQMGVNAGGYIDLVRKQIGERGMEKKVELIDATILYSMVQFCRVQYSKSL
jgi:hypothetical protein